MRSSTEVCLRNCASAAGSRDSSSKRKYSETNRSSPVKPSALAELGAPACIDSAARYRPAGQPSVRSVSSESSLGVELDAGRLQQQPGLLLVQPQVRHADLVHAARAPASGPAAAPAPPCSRSRSASPAGRTRTAPPSDVQARRIGDGVQVVEHEHERALERGQRAPEPRDALSTRSIRPDPTARRTPRRGSGSTRWIAAAM